MNNGLYQVARRSVAAAGAVVGTVALGMLVGLVGAQAAPGSWAFTRQSPSSGPGGRVFDMATAGLDGKSGVFYGGEVPSGTGPGTALADTWVNTPTGWRAVCGTTVAGATAGCRPGVRSAGGMGAGPNGPVLFGGFSDGFGNGTPVGDTWQFNGASWVRACATAKCGPAARALPAVGGNGSQVVLFGGLALSQGGDPAPLSDTWVFNGTSWTQLCGATPLTACGPVSRAGASLGWDGRHFVLFGGAANVQNNTAPLADTWILQGNRWIPVCGAASLPVCGPPGRILGAIAYAADPRAASGALLAEGGNLFGKTENYLLRDAWFFNAVTERWTTAPASWTGPPVTFPANGTPAVGPDPLFGAIAAEPALCTVVYRGTHVTSAAPNFSVGSLTYTAGTAAAQANGSRCTPAPAPVTTARPTPPPRPRTTPLPRPPSTHAPIRPQAATTHAQLAATGIHDPAGLLTMAALLVLTGAFIVTINRRGRPGAHR